MCLGKCATCSPEYFSYPRPIVGAVAVLEIAHLCLSTHTTYEVLARGFGNPLVLLRLPMSGAPLPAMNGLGACFPRPFWYEKPYRHDRQSHSWILHSAVFCVEDQKLGKECYGENGCLGGYIGASIEVPSNLECSKLIGISSYFWSQTAVLQMGASIGVAIQFTLHNGEAMLLRQLSTAVIIWLAGSFGCDIFISITMVCLLVDAKASTSYASSKGIINALIVHTIENGLVTTVCALVVLISYFALPDTAYNISL